MTAKPASIFDDDVPAAPPRPAAEQVRALAESVNFPSREGRPAQTVATGQKRAPRIHRTGRTATISLKTTPAAADQFYAIADREKWLVGETFERALAALERELAGRG
jgi:hypothetical protein